MSSTCKLRSLPLFLATTLMTTPAIATAQQPAAQTPGSAETASEPPRPVRRPMFEAGLDGLKSPDGTKGVDSVMYITDFPPGSISTRHFHPGWEFNYILKGEVTYEVSGKAPFTLKAGQGTYAQRGTVHVVRNASAMETAQLVSVLVKDANAAIAVNAP